LYIKKNYVLLPPYVDITCIHELKVDAAGVFVSENFSHTVSWVIT